MARPVWVLWGGSIGHLVALAAVAGTCLTSAAVGQPVFSAGSQLPDATNSKTMAEGRAMILADPVDVQILMAVSPATMPALTAVRNDPLLSTTLAATIGLSTPFGELSERVLPGVVDRVGTYLLTNNSTRSAFDAIAVSPATAAVLAATSTWTPDVGSLVSDSSGLMSDLLPFSAVGKQGRRLMQTAIATPALVAGGAVPLATGAAAAGSILASFVEGGITALNALSTGLTDVASAALAGQAAALVEKVAPAAVAVVQTAVTVGAAIKAKIESASAGSRQASSAGAATGRRMLQSHYIALQ